MVKLIYYTQPEGLTIEYDERAPANNINGTNQEKS